MGGGDCQQARRHGLWPPGDRGTGHHTLVHNGITIVSGLARGIDAIAHSATLKAGGRTLAVLGSGIDHLYPPEHRGLAEKIMAQGAVLSDYAPGIPPESANYPPRNRIISGLSLTAVVIEAANQGRDVRAISSPRKAWAPTA